MFPCQSPAAWSTASAFCATVTAGGSTATNYPTRATAACGPTPDRYLSVCGCGPTCTPTPTGPTTTPSASCTPPPTVGLLPNGDFECALEPWTVQVPDLAAKTSITSPGNTGSKAFQVRLFSSPSTPQMGVSARIISPRIAVAANVPCKLKFSAFFDNLEAGMIGVLINGAPVWTIDAKDKGANKWVPVAVDYTPQTDYVTITFEFLFGLYPSIDKIDSVEFNYLH
jgi:hypothetical protein